MNVMTRPVWEVIEENYDFPLIKVADKNASFDLKVLGVRCALEKQTNSTIGFGSINYKRVRYNTYALMILSLFKDSEEPIYKIGTDFGHMLFKVKLNITASVLPESDKLICIEFPQDMIFKTSDGKMCKSCFIYVISPKNITSNVGKVHKYLDIFTPIYEKDGSFMFDTISSKIVFTSETENIDDAINRSMQMNEKYEMIDFIFYAVKCFLYIHSGDPDLREYKAPKLTIKSDNKIRAWREQNPDISLVDMTYVGYNFKKVVIPNPELTAVSGHYRFQPYGKGRTKVKLIWIAEHEARIGKRGQR